MRHLPVSKIIQEMQQRAFSASTRWKRIERHGGNGRGQEAGWWSVISHGRCQITAPSRSHYNSRQVPRLPHRHRTRTSTHTNTRLLHVLGEQTVNATTVSTWGWRLAHTATSHLHYHLLPIPRPSPRTHANSVTIRIGNALWKQQLSQQQVALTLLTPGSLIVTSGSSLFFNAVKTNSWGKSYIIRIITIDEFSNYARQRADIITRQKEARQKN